MSSANCTTLPALLAFLLSPAVANADSVDEMCLQSNDSEDICVCATEKLKAAVGSDDYVIYEDMGQKYIVGLSQGLGRSDAWDAAGEEVALSRQTSYTSILNSTNKTGKAHRSAINSCKNLPD